MKVRETTRKAEHMTATQTGFASPTEVMTIAVDSQVATANELRRKST